MAISFVAASAVATGVNPTVAVPSGYAANDLLIIVQTSSNSSSVTPTGWTQLAKASIAPIISVYYKIASASESSVTLTGNSLTIATMLCYRGTSGFDVTSSFVRVTSTTVTTNSITTTAANDFVISIYGATSVALGTPTWTAPASTTSRVNAGPTTTLTGFLIVDELKATAGATTSRTATISASDTIQALATSIKESAAATVNSNFFLLMQ